MIFKNIIIILCTLGIVGMGIFAYKYVFDKVFNVIEKLANNFALILGPRIKHRWSRPLLELILLLSVPVMLFLIPVEYRDLALPIYSIFIFLIGAINQYIRKELPESFSILEFISNKINTKNYFVNRFSLVINQGDSILFLLAAITITLTFLIELKWPDFIYYGLILIIPLYTNVWIYFTYKLSFNKDEEQISIRRLIAYFLLVIFVCNDTYIKFFQFFFEKDNKPDEVHFLLYIGSIIFIALDRFLKALIDDYNEFENQLKMDK